MVDPNDTTTTSISNSVNGELEVKKLRQKKGIIKGQATKLLTFIETCEETNSTTGLQSRLDFHKDNYKKFEQLSDLIFDLVVNDELQTEAELQDRLEYEEKYFNIIGRAESLLPQTVQRQSKFSSSSSSINSINSIHAAEIQPHHNIRVKLPVIELPKFSGNISEWLCFYDLFDSLINNNESLTDIQRFHYLKSCLRGEAANAIQSLSVCARNYEVAWTTLREQFEHKKLIVDVHLKALFSLRTVESDSATSIRSHLNEFQKHVRALAAINEPSVSTLLIYLSTSKLDFITKDKWEEHCLNIEDPELSNLTDFLNNRCKVLESRVAKSRYQKTSQGQQKNTTVHVTTLPTCPVCTGDHRLYHCSEFKNLAVNKRWDVVQRKSLCAKCFNDNHTVQQCNSKNCYKCHKKHNTLLHRSDTTASTTSTTLAAAIPTKQIDRREDVTTVEPEPESTGMPVMHTSTAICKPKGTISTSQVLLSTVMVRIRDSAGNLRDCRAIIDSGSQSNLMTEWLARDLKLPLQKIKLSVTGVGATESHIHGKITATMLSNHTSYSADIECLVMKQITQPLPITSININELGIPNNIKLADPTCGTPGPIDLLLGAEVFWNLLCIGQIKLWNKGAVLNKTKLGWVLSGRINQQQNTSIVCTVRTDVTDEQLTRFWEIENIDSSTTPVKSSAIETHFCENVRRDASGRFNVSLPFNDKKCNLGASRQQALTRFYSLERKFDKYPDIFKQYSAFMSEYEQLGHMQVITTIDNAAYYLPHHAVFRSESLTTKCRVVFDGSAKTTSGISLNDTLLAGPVIQDDIVSILLRFRKHSFVITCDIVKMYRQILINECDRQYQLILWRESPNEEVKTYKLNTVTYGITCAPFLATRCLVELANQEENHFPRATAVLKRDFYVDDCITGCKTLEEAESLKIELTELTARGGFVLQKWRSNAQCIMEEHLDNSLPLSSLENMKTLGLWWNCKEDMLYYTVPEAPQLHKKITKRSILSDIARLFDPLGLVGPVIVTAKIMIQSLWNLKLNWDESVPTDIHTKWCNYREEFNDLQQLKINRRVTDSANMSEIELHGFSDASEKAYGACVYVRTINKDRSISTSLLCAKSRVAPTKIQTIPRLELCGALLLARLMQKVKNSMELTFNKEVYWIDSSVVLAWVSSESNTLKTFVGNRVAEIHSLTSPSDWRHVRTHNNPADIISRGLSPRDLVISSMWWDGPPFLRKSPDEWPVLVTDKKEEEDTERKPPHVFAVIETHHLITKYSSFGKLQRVTAYCFRFINNCQIKWNIVATRNKQCKYEFIQGCSKGMFCL